MTTYLRSATSNALKRLASFVEPQAPSPAQPTAPTTHCSTCFCAYMPSKIREEDWHLLIDDNGDPYGPAKLRELARQAADTYYTDRGGADLDKRRRVFTLYASQLSKRAPNHDFGVSYLTCADDWHKVQIASTVARYVSKLGKWPTRATAIEHLEQEEGDPLLLNHLRLIDAAAEDAANQRAGIVEAGTEVVSTHGTR